MDLNALIKTQSEKKLPPRVLLYTIPGWGKSTLAASSDRPIFLDLEDGLRNIDTPALPPPETYDIVEGYIRQLINEDHNFKTIVIDSTTSLEKLIEAKVCKDNNVNSIEKIGYGKGRVYAMTYWEKIKTGLDCLRKRKNMTVFLLAHSIVKSFSSPLIESYDKYFLNLHKHPANFIISWSDYILFGDHKVYVEKIKEGFQKQSKGVGAGVRVIYTDERPGFVAKSRGNMPFTLEIPKKEGWKTIQEFIK